jgi:NADH dehydrogenase
MVGGEICRLLADSNRPFRALIRSSSAPAKIEALERLGAGIVRGDLRDPASLDAACRGATHVISTASAMPFAYVPGENTPDATDRDGSLNLVDAARRAGARRFVYVSFPPMTIPFPLQDAKRAVETRLRDSGMTYTVLRPTYFTEIWLSPAVGFDHTNQAATIYGTGENAISWISYLDVARFGVESLDHPAAANATLWLGGPDGIAPNDVVRLFERIAGRPFTVTHVAPEALQDRFAAAADPMQQSFTALMLGYAGATAIDMTDTLSTFPLKLRSVEEYARAVTA